MIVTLFAGRGGACEGIKEALGVDPDVAINHDEIALAVHRAVHPNTRHLCGNVWHYDPKSVTKGRRVTGLWASPTCTQFSQAKGGKPLDRREATRIRALAWVVVRWAREVRPDWIMVENVKAFQHWGRLDNEGKASKAHRGETFRRWVADLRKLGYAVEWRMLRASDFGAPTSRERLFVVARCDGLPIVWPTPTHGSAMWEKPLRTAADCLDFTRKAPSIFDGRRKPLSLPARRRIARGIKRFVLEAADPFVVETLEGPVVPTLVHVSNGERPGQAPRIYDIRAPLGTVVAGGIKHALVCVFVAKNFGGHEGPGQSVRSPLGTITTRDHHALVTVKLGRDRRPEVDAFLKEHGLSNQVTIRGESYTIVDIGYRLLEPAELARAHDLATVSVDANGRKVTKTAQIRLIGNSVPKKLAAAVVAANVHRPQAVAA